MTGIKRQIKVPSLWGTLLFMIYVLLFLGSILFAHFSSGDQFIMPVLLMLIPLLLGFYYMRNYDVPSISFNHILLVIFYTIIGSILVGSLRFGFDIDPVIASSVVTLLSLILIKHIFRTSSSADTYSAAIFCGSFIGMSSENVISSGFVLLMASIISGLVLGISERSFVGIGGKLGTAAFIGISTASVISFYLSSS